MCKHQSPGGVARVHARVCVIMCASVCIGYRVRGVCQTRKSGARVVMDGE